MVPPSPARFVAAAALVHLTSGGVSNVWCGAGEGTGEQPPGVPARHRAWIAHPARPPCSRVARNSMSGQRSSVICRLTRVGAR